jgi:hypothetical protein
MAIIGRAIFKIVGCCFFDILRPLNELEIFV